MEVSIGEILVSEFKGAGDDRLAYERGAAEAVGALAYGTDAGKGLPAVIGDG